MIASSSLLSPRLQRSSFGLALCGLILGFWWFGVFNVSAQTAGGTGEIRGRVINKATGEYLRNAVVKVEGTNLSTVAESGGEYNLSGVPAGEVTLSVTYTGLDTQQQKLTVVAGQIATQDISLTSKVYDKDVVTMGEFVVGAEREGNAKAVMEQKGSVNMKKIISSDVFGDVSEGNVGEFLKLMPGVSVDYVEADVRTIRVRGYNPKYARVLMDGAPVASAGSSDIATGRAFEFEQLSISSIDTVELSKTPTPDQPSAVAGVVNLRSKGAFDRKGRRIDWSFSVAENGYYMGAKRDYLYDDKKHWWALPNGSLSFSDVFFKGKLGVQAGTSFSKSMAAQKHIRPTYRFDSDATNNATEIPRISNFNYRDGPKPTNRANFNLRLDYKFNPDFIVTGRVDFNVYDAAFFNRDINIGAPNNANNVYNAPGGTLKDPTIEYSMNSQTSTGGTASSSSGNNNKAGDTLTLLTKADYRYRNLRFEPSFVYSRSRNVYRNLSEGYFDGYSASVTGINWRFNRASPSDTAVTFTQLSGADWRNLGNYNTDGINPTATSRRGKDQQYTGKGDFTYSITDWKVPVRLKFGVYSNLAVRDVERLNGTAYDYVGADGVKRTADDNPSLYQENGYVVRFGSGGNVEAWPMASVFKLADLYGAQPNWFRPLSALSLLQLLQQNSWDYQEQVNAGYIQPLFKWGRLDIAPGFRHEQTYGKGRGPKDVGDSRARQKLGLKATDPIPDAIAYLLARYGQDSRSHKYGNSFKYLHVNYRWTDNLVFRGSYHEAITRADLSNLVAGYTYSDANQTITSNNPDLKPERSRNINLGLEYYWEPSSSVSVYVFRSNIKDLQLRVGNQIVGPEGFDGDLSFVGYRLTEWENVSSAHTTGIELDYSQQLTFLPKAFRGLGIFGNYTHLEFDTWYNFPGSAKDQGSGGLNYRYRNFYAQFKATWTGQKQTTSGSRPANGLVDWEKDRLMFDINADYRIGKNLQVFVNGRNITNTPLVTYSSRQAWYTRKAWFGALWSAGIKGNF